MSLPAIASKIDLKETKDFNLSSALDAWLTSKDGELGYRILEDRTFVYEDSLGNTVIRGNLKTGGSLDVGGKIFFRNGLVVEGDTWLRDKLRVEEDTVLDGDVYINANLYVSKDFQLGQDGSIRGNLSVEDSITVNDLIVTGNAQINSLLNVNNDQVITGDLDVGGSIADGDGDVRDDINDEFLAAQSSYYSEYTYDVDGNLTDIDVWESVSKVTKLFTKVLTYTTGNLTGVVLTDEINSNTLTKTLTYDVDGNLETLTRSYA